MHVKPDGCEWLGGASKVLNYGGTKLSDGVATTLWSPVHAFVPLAMPERFYFMDGADFAFSWTELPGVDCKPIRMADFLDAAMTQEFIARGPAPRVTAPLPTFTPKRAKPAIAGLMCEHDGPVRGIGYCAG